MPNPPKYIPLNMLIPPLGLNWPQASHITCTPPLHSPMCLLAAPAIFSDLYPPSVQASHIIYTSRGVYFGGLYCTMRLLFHQDRVNKQTQNIFLLHSKNVLSFLDMKKCMPNLYLAYSSRDTRQFDKNIISPVFCSPVFSCDLYCAKSRIPFQPYNLF